jgi:hypothetical protein
VVEWAYRPDQPPQVLEGPPEEMSGGYMYNRPNGRGGFVATDMSGAGVPKNALRVPCRRYPYFFGNL